MHLKATHFPNFVSSLPQHISTSNKDELEVQT